MNTISSPIATPEILIDRKLLKILSAPAPARLLAQTACEWSWIFLCSAVAISFDHWVINLICMLVIATRQHALLVLMHEFSHYQFSRKHAYLNDLLGDVLTAFPFFITIHGFRRNHLLHHRHAWTAHDPNYLAAIKKPQYQFPKTRPQLLLEIAKHSLGYYTFSELKRYTISAGMAVSLPRRVHVHRVIFTMIFIFTTSYFDLWQTVLLCWITPMATFLMAILYVRDLGEHFGLPKDCYASARTVRAQWPERFLIAQNGVNFHADHHRFPSVPFFRLHVLHRTLMDSQVEQQSAVVTDGYLTGLAAELTLSAKT